MIERNTLKELLNNLTLLKWVKKFSSDNLLEDNSMAKEKFSITSTENSVSILDKSATKLLVTKAQFEGEELVRFNLSQLNELIEVAGKEGELIISKSEMRELIAKVGNDLIVVCPLPQKDKVKKK
jgi:hypothetical protein